MKNENSSSILFIVIIIGLLVGIGLYMVNKMNYIKKMNENEKDETTTTINASSTTTTETTTTTGTTHQHITINPTSKVNTQPKSTTTTTKKSTTSTTSTTNTTASQSESSVVDKARNLANKQQAQLNDLLSRVNNLRQSEGLNALTLDNTLNIAACIRAQEMADNSKMSHTRPNGTKFNTVFDEVHMSKPSTAGENVASSTGSMNSEKVYEVWLNSPSHRENMVTSKYKKMGACGATNSKGATYWAQLFIG